MLNDFTGAVVVVGGGGIGGNGAGMGQATLEEVAAATIVPVCNFVRLFSSSCTCFGNLNRFLRRKKLPFSNMSNADGWRAQKAPLPGLSGRLGILMKQSLKERLCLREFCQRWVLRL